MEKHIPFDLERAKAGDPVITCCYEEARILCYDLKDKDYSLVAAIQKETKNIFRKYEEKVVLLTEFGNKCKNNIDEYMDDLYMKYPKVSPLGLTKKEYVKLAFKEYKRFNEDEETAYSKTQLLKHIESIYEELTTKEEDKNV